MARGEIKKPAGVTSLTAPRPDAPIVTSDRAASGATSDRPARTLSAVFLGLLGGSPSSLIGRLLA